jgi:hypothetical protein
MKVRVDIIKCKTCGKLGVVINDRRLTDHKCGVGQWSIEHSEQVDKRHIRDALKTPDMKIN